MGRFIYLFGWVFLLLVLHGLVARGQILPLVRGKHLGGMQPLGTGDLAFQGAPAQVCPNVEATYTVSGSGCSGWSWEANGGTFTSVTNTATVNIKWASTGTYTVKAVATCGGTTQSVSTSVTVVDTTPGTITATGGITQGGKTTICLGGTVKLNPPSGSTNWAWSGAYVTGTDAAGIATVQPTAEVNTYTLTYTKSGTTCPVVSTYEVDVALPPGTVNATAASSSNGTAWQVGTGLFTFSVQNPTAAYTYTWYDSPTSTGALATGSSYQTYVTQSRTYYVTATACQEGPRTAVSALVRRVQLLVAGTLPTKSLATPQVLQASAPSYGGSYAWFFNGLQITDQTGAMLNVTQPGRYTVRINYPNSPPLPEYESQPVDVGDGLAGQTLANGQPLTYLSDTRVLTPNVTDAAQLPLPGAGDQVRTITYLTGWAQPLQQVGLQTGPAQEDLVQHFAYSGSPATSQTYLPVPLSRPAGQSGVYEADPTGKAAAYYSNRFSESQPYATATAEASPLGRPVSQAAAGAAWSAHAASVAYTTNTDLDGVHRWVGLDGSAVYAAGQLTKQVQLDPDNRRTEVFSDFLGRTVLQRKITNYNTMGQQSFDTYTVYAPTGYVQYVVPPMAVKSVAGTNWVVSTALADQYLYRYKYDDRGRLVERQFPGAKPVYLVYDQFSRPVLVQDGTHRAANQWLFTKFDALGRAVVSGLYASTASQASLQSQADAQTGEYESRTAGGYTTNATFPAAQDGTAGAVLLSVNLYEDYDLNQDGSPDYTYVTQALGTDPQPVATTLLLGLPTVTLTRVVQPGGSYGQWLTTALFYDDYGNLIQKRSNNILQSGAVPGDATTLVYRQQGFVPQVLRSVKTQQNFASGFSPSVTVRNRFSYDAAGRLLSTWQQHQWKNTWEPEVLVSRNVYTGLGELTQKKLHGRDEVQFLQTEDLGYNLHGQLARINSSNGLLTTDNATEKDLFALTIYRETNPYNAAPRYDGGISALDWASANFAPKAQTASQPKRQRRYTFAYDGLGRLTDATFAARPKPWYGWTYETGAYDEKAIVYDANGNITALQRYSQTDSTATTATLIDNLTYTYTGNQHSAVDDAASTNRGFKDARTTTEYAYDDNGSIIRDDNKGVSYVFNALNKVEKQTVGTRALVYTYDANGNVLRRDITNSGTPSKSDYYVDGFVYLAAPGYSGPVSVPTAEGRAVVNATTDARLSYEYHLRDHLGNLRVAFRAQAGTEDLRLSSEDPAKEEGAYPKFQNVTATRLYLGTANARHGSYVAAVSSAQAGPSIAIPVAHQDHLKLRLYCKTSCAAAQRPAAAPLPLPATVALAVAPTVLPVAAPTEAQPTRAVPGVQLSIGGLLSGAATRWRRPAPADPAALAAACSVAPYLKWTLTDPKGNVVRSGSPSVNVTTDGQWTQYNLPLDIDLSGVDSRTGTLTIQELNSSSQVVYFDSLTITHPQDRALVSQENHYYPLGMAQSGLAVNTTPVSNLSKEQFNDGSLLQDELLGSEGGVYSTFYRTYDPATGRFTGVDPLAEATVDWTPYQFALGNPAAANDPTGALASWSGWDSFIRAALNDEVEEGNYTSSGGGGGISDFIGKTGDFSGLQLSVRNGQAGYYTFEGGNEHNEVIITANFHKIGGGPWWASKYDPNTKDIPSDKQWSEVKTNPFNITTFTNNSNVIIWLKPDNNWQPIVAILPGQSSTYRIDGLTHPNHPGEVFKVGTALDLNYGLVATDAGIFFRLNPKVAEAVNDFRGGGWLTKEPGGWLSKAPDKGWYEIFDEVSSD